MTNSIYSITNPVEYNKASPYDLIKLIPPPDHHPLIIPKFIPELLVYGIVMNEKIHISGKTGSAKSKLISDMQQVPENFSIICEAMDFDPVTGEIRKEIIEELGLRALI